MKILFINQFFWPDSAATAQQLTDLTNEMASQGHEVSVLCGGSGYATAPGTEPPAAHVYRVKDLPFGRGKVGRVLSYLSFYVSALVRGVFLPKMDVVVSMTTPPLVSLIGTCIKSVRGSKHFIWEQDVYPDIAVDLQYFRAGGALHRITGFLSDFSRNHADGVIALGECMRQRLIRRGLAPEKIEVAEHWANSSAITPLERPGDPKELVLLYSGNLGLAHDLDTITDTIRSLRSDTRFRFLFVGTGGRRQELEDFCKTHEISSVELRPFVARNKLSEGLAAGDIGLVTQQNVSCGSVVPSKVYGILAAGRPILFIGPAEATPALIIKRHNCGWHFNCGDAEGVKNLLLQLANTPDAVKQAGERARQALVDFYDTAKGTNRIATLLNEKSKAVPQKNALYRTASNTE